MRTPRVKARKLVVPIALTVVLSATTITGVSTALSVITSAGCGGDGDDDDGGRGGGDDGPHVDASIDTPII